MHKITGVERPVTFDPDAAGDRTDVVLLHLGSRLVQMCMHLLRAELWAQAGGRAGAAKLSRVTARVVPGDLLRTPALAAHGRVVVTGAEGTRLHEEIIVAGGPIDGGRLGRAKQAEVESWLAAASDEVPGQPVREQLVGLWRALADPLRRALATRAEQRSRSVHGLLARRRDEETEAVKAVLQELDRSIRSALDDTQLWEQPTLFEVEQRDQLYQDHEALRARLASIPAQIDRETEALRRRYAEPTARWFPAAVTFLVPASLAHTRAAGGAR